MTGSARDVIRRLQQHEPLFEDVETYPQLGVLQRFVKYRMQNLYYLEEVVERKHTDVVKFMREAAAGMIPEQGIEAGFATTMEAQHAALDKHATACEQLRQMCRSDEVSPYFMDFYRSRLSRVDGSKNACAPELGNTCYGAYGQPVPRSLTAPMGADMSHLENFLVHQVEDPWLEYIWDPLKHLWTRLRTGRRPGYKEDLTPNIKLRKTNFIAKIIASIGGTCVLIGAIAVLDSTRDRRMGLVAMAFICVLFALLVQLLHPSSMPAYSLITGFFQAMVIFVATSKPSAS